MSAAKDYLRSAAIALQRGLFPAALTEAETGLQDHPHDPALLGLAALAALRLDQGSKAADYLTRQLAETPGDRAARYNLATTLAGLGQLSEALELARDYQGHAKLARLTGYLCQQGADLPAAIAAYQEAVTLAPDDWESWNNLGNCCAEAGDTQAAIEAFENAINRAPVDLPEPYLNLCQALGTIENRDARLLTAEVAARRFPDNPSVQIEHGLALVGTGRNDAAIGVLYAAATREPNFGEAHVELGLLYEHTNRLDALEALIAQAEPDPDNQGLAFIKAWNLRRQDRFDEARVLATGLSDVINPVRVAQLRAEIADRLGEPVEAFRQFTLMNQASAKASRPLSDQSYRAMITGQTAAMTGPPGPPLPLAGQAPIFVVGFPRSGTTLLDTLLSALPELQVFEEKPLLAQVEAEFPGLATSIDAAAIVAARARYYALAESFEGPAAGRRIVDKHPLHMTKLPLIDRLFPAAQVVLVERHPCDAVLSCFMANFLLNTAMRSFIELEETARTYAAVFANFTRACELYPVAVHRVRYERMIENLAGELRPLLAFLGLPWRDEVLDNQASAARRGTVRTASYAQIGQPLYQRAAGRWQRYRAQLEPVLPILQPWIAQLGYQE